MYGAEPTDLSPGWVQFVGCGGVRLLTWQTFGGPVCLACRESCVRESGGVGMTIVGIAPVGL